MTVDPRAMRPHRRPARRDPPHDPGYPGEAAQDARCRARLQGWRWASASTWARYDIAHGPMAPVARAAVEGAGLGRWLRG